MVKKFKIIVFICGIALCFNFIAKVYFVNSQNKKIIVLQNVIRAARSDNYLKTNKVLPKKYDHKNDIHKMLKQIPEEFLFTEYAVKIRSLIDKNKLFIDNSLVFRSGKSEHPDMLKYNTRITVKGSYSKIKKLMSDLQNLPGLIYVESPSMIRTKENPQWVQMDFDLFVIFRRGSA